ncbi:MAG: hypothetical protein ACR2HG_06400 [Pyrinomonadaceae bacterium]
MFSVRCTVTLLKDKNRKVDIEIFKDPKGNQLWKVIRAAGGSLRLSALEGDWDVNGGEMLSLWYKPTNNEKTTPFGSITLFVEDVKQNFLQDIIGNGTSFVAENASLFNDNPSEKDVTCSFSRMN